MRDGNECESQVALKIYQAAQMNSATLALRHHGCSKSDRLHVTIEPNQAYEVSTVQTAGEAPQIT